MNTIALKRIFGFAGILLLTSAVLVYAGKPTGKSARKVQKGTTNDTYHPMNINNVYNYYGNNGDGSFNPFSSDAEGFDFNKVTGANIIFEDGIVWGGYENNGTDSTLKVGGSTYNHGLQAGKILTYGHDTTLPVADNPGALKYRLFRVRADINPHTPEADVMDLLNAESADIGRYESGATPDLIYQAYIKDWNEWPAADGAPYTDVNHNGVYDPLVDIPGVTGADQTMWYVANDVDAGRTVGLYGSQPIGFEFQRTIWAYKAGPGTEYLGYTIFISNKIINKSGHDIDSMFITQWSDPDLGGSKSFNDNYVGCDTSNSRDLGYVYQGVSPDAEFGYLPPVGGFVLLQGPAVAGSATDSVMRDFKFRTGLKKLRMSSFNFFINGNATYSDPPFTADGTRQWYNLMNGFVGNTKAAYVDPTTGLTSKFLLWGDPVSGTGWLDGQLAGPADRRMCQTAGPFTFAAGDTEEIIIANSAALCGDRVSGIDKLRFFTDQMKSLYNVAFNKPPIPPSPKVTVAILNNQAVLVWEDSLTNAKDEGYDQAGFKFEGYNVYQFPTNSPDLSIAKRLATFDEKNLITRIQDVVFDPTLCAALREPVEFGGDNGVQHYLNLTTDAFNTFGQGLVDGQTYYFAVTAYAYNPSPGLVGNHLESQVAVISVTPHGTNPGNRYGGVFGDTVTAVTHTATGGARTSDGSVYPLVIDQSKLTGDTYKVTFSTAASGTLVWHLTDATKGIQLEADSNQSGDANYRIIDGIMWKVQGPPPGMGNYSIPAGTREWSSVDGNSGLEGFGGAIGWGTSWFSGTTLT
ncbi:MAG TPA: hypothetical protein VKS81_02465, partial [Bacteroidota bacterium]|nr:hypothetical protein [Bacteroidota bacterium]